MYVALLVMLFSSYHSSIYLVFFRMSGSRYYAAIANGWERGRRGPLEIEAATGLMGEQDRTGILGGRRFASFSMVRPRPLLGWTGGEALFSWVGIPSLQRPVPLLRSWQGSEVMSGMKIMFGIVLVSLIGTGGLEL